VLIKLFHLTMFYWSSNRFLSNCFLYVHMDIWYSTRELRIFLIAAIWSYLIHAAVLHRPTQANVAHLQILRPDDMTTARGRRTLPSLPALVRESVSQWNCTYSKTDDV